MTRTDDHPPALVIDRCQPEDASALAAFAARNPFAYNDFASIAASGGALTQTWAVRDDAGAIVAAAIDDQLAMAVAGDPGALAALGRGQGPLHDRLALSGRAEEVRAFAAAADLGPRRERAEWLMAVDSREIASVEHGDVELRLATDADLELLARAREDAIREEHGAGVLAGEDGPERVRAALASAIAMRGVAIWVVDDQVAFTVQLVSRTPAAASFSDLYVDPALRGQGRATRALSAFCEWLFAASEVVLLRVGIENSPAIRLYEKLGFRTVDEFRTFLKAPEHGDG